MLMPRQFAEGLVAAPVAMSAIQLVLRASVGSFFAASGYNKVFVPEVREKVQGLFAKLKVPKPLAQAIPVGELLGGLGLLAGAMVPVAAAGLLAILAGAVVLDVWKSDVAGKHPRNLIDWVSKAQDIPEYWMILALVMILLVGGGQFSLDALI